MASKLVCLKNFHCNDRMPRDKNTQPDKQPPFREWQEGEEYDGEDDQDRLQEEGLIGEEEAPKGKKGKKPAKGKKAVTELEEDEAITTEGEEVEETTPADGGSDAEEPVKPAKKAKGKGGKKKKG